MTKEEFVELLTIMQMRSRTKEIVGYRRSEDVPTGPIDDDYDADMENWGSLCVVAFGRICVDDHDEKPRRETTPTGQLNNITSLYPLDEIHTDKWPDGLFEKLSSYTWWIDPEDEISPLDVMAAQANSEKREKGITGGMATPYDPDSSTDGRGFWV